MYLIVDMSSLIEICDIWRRLPKTVRGMLSNSNRISIAFSDLQLNLILLSEQVSNISNRWVWAGSRM